MKSKRKIVVVGGSAAGPKAAAKAKRINREAEIIMLQKDHDLSMASCAYPYYIGGHIDDREALISTSTGVVRDPEYFRNAKGIETRVDTEVTAIDRGRQIVSFRNILTGDTDEIAYDKLILSTGSLPRVPPIPGIELKGITTLHSIKDCDFIKSVVDQGRTNQAAVIGGGLIGIETCEALHQAGIEVTVIELLPQILTFLDWEISKLLENHIKGKGVNVITGNGIAGFLGEDGGLTGVKLKNGTEIPCTLAVVATGVRPNTALAQSAGLDIGELGGIKVNEYMQTSDPDIYAIGDCVETRNRITGKIVHAPFGDLANLQGRVAGENAASTNCVKFPGTIQTG
ncbi:MAG: FAD-dependent oxidoreductase, partial [Dehalococcoidia bacterium]|nr:FAD-dependent oxidoreductase [Dehalococcoidia bacterium]